MVLTIKYRAFRCKFSHHPVLWNVGDLFFYHAWAMPSSANLHRPRKRNRKALTRRQPLGPQKMNDLQSKEYVWQHIWINNDKYIRLKMEGIPLNNDHFGEMVNHWIWGPLRRYKKRYRSVSRSTHWGREEPLSSASTNRNTVLRYPRKYCYNTNNSGYIWLYDGIYIYIYTLLVGGIPTPLKNMSHLGWWHYQDMEK